MMAVFVVVAVVVFLSVRVVAAIVVENLICFESSVCVCFYQIFSSTAVSVCFC